MENRSSGRRHGGPMFFDKDQPAVSFRSIQWTRLLEYLKPYWKLMGGALLALLISSGFGLAFPLVIVKLLDTVTQAKSTAPLNQLALALVVIFLLQALFSFVQSYLLTYIGEHIVYDLRQNLYDHLQRLSLDFYALRRVGEIVSRLSSDVTQVRNLLTTNLTSLLSQAVSLIGSVVILLTLNTRLTLFILALAPLLIIIAFFFGSRIQKASLEVQDQLANSTTVAEEGLQAVRVVKSFGRENFETERYNGALEKTFRASLKMALYHSAFASLMMFLGFASIAAIIWQGGREVIAGSLTLAMVTGFLMYGVTIAASLGGLGGLYAQLRAALGGVQRVFEIIDAAPSVQDSPTAQVIGSAQGRIEFKDVSFSYEKDSAVLQHVSLDIQSGEILALVGPSGAGKSTIFNLIPRFYDPTEGAICLDGVDLRDITQASLRDQIAIVPQETILFGGTIRENILYGRLDASEDEIIAAAKAANAHDFVMGFPQQYETIVGERGARLSGGQRQRIAIARAILKDPRILLLDEATSSLDNESEELVQEALERLMQNRTTIIIAHRLSTVKVAHRIAVIDAGRIIEVGDHVELMEQNGMYARLYTMQFRDPEEELAGLLARLQETPQGEAIRAAQPSGLMGIFGD